MPSYLDLKPTKLIYSHYLDWLGKIKHLIASFSTNIGDLYTHIFNLGVPLGLTTLTPSPSSDDSTNIGTSAAVAISPLPKLYQLVQYIPMKSAIHPKYNQITVTCSCGASFLTGSTRDAMTVDICAKCHPFFTGEMRFVDQLGRVEKFQAKQKAATGKKAKKDRKGTQSGPQTLTDIRAQA